MAEYSYTYDNGGTLSQMNVGSDTLTFTYDASGRPLALDYNGTDYYYVTNLQGDITAILNKAGTAVVTYTYDAWGNALTVTGPHAATLGTLNPLRYRGYVYDTETGFYYLQSRYYDPQIGRFINADALVATGQGLLGNNMFAYCLNNPVNANDPSGTCTKFFFGLIKIDCHNATCPESSNYNPNAPKVVVIYDGRFSGYFGYLHDNGFAHQGEELVERLSSSCYVESYSYITVEDFVSCWNTLDGAYDAMYIVGHGIKGELRFKGGKSIAAQDGTYCYSDLNPVEISTIHLYSCNGATTDEFGGSIAEYLFALTGASVRAIKDGKLNLTWYGCYPVPANGGYWVTIE